MVLSPVWRKFINWNNCFSSTFKYKINDLTQFAYGRVVYNVLKSNVEMFFAFFLPLILPNFLIIESEFLTT